MVVIQFLGNRALLVYGVYEQNKVWRLKMNEFDWVLFALTLVAIVYGIVWLGKRYGK